MAEQQNEEKSVADALEDKPEKDSGGRGKILRLLLPVGIAVLAGAGGHVVNKMLAGDSTPAQAVADSQQADGQVSQQGDSTGSNTDEFNGEIQEYVYHDMDPITANVNVPRLTRHVRVTLTLALRKEGADEAIEVIESKMPDLRNWVTVYLADRSIDDLRGAKSLNRILSDIGDSFNDMLWPNQRPRILKMMLKEWVVQ